jgi:hypothetical protein
MLSPEQEVDMGVSSLFQVPKPLRAWSRAPVSAWPRGHS